MLTFDRPDRLVFSWETVRDGIDADQGWPLYLDRFATLTGAGTQ